MLRLSVFVPLILVACSAPTTPSSLRSEALSHLAPHDVSILMPYVERPELLDVSPVLSQQEQLSDAGFLPPGVIEHLKERFGDSSPGDAGINPRALDHYKIASIRIDPCANLVVTQGKRELCAAQFRLVWQHLSRFDNGALFDNDDNIHAVYSLSQDELETVIAELSALRKASGKVYGQEALGPHPIIAQEGNGPFYQGVMRLVSTYAVPSRLNFLAALADVHLAGAWILTGFQITGGEIQKKPLMNLEERNDGKPNLIIGIASGQGGILNLPEEKATTKPSIFDEPSTGPLDHILQIENPLSHDISNTDCASCHMARIQRADNIWRYEHRGRTIPPDVSSVSGSYPDTRWNRERRSDFSDLHNSLQMFSFASGQYAVSQRTINETAEVMNWLERNLP